ncbi:phiSA1p31-related protein [Streptomyces griseus]|uniref:phiSA1p31-related protein n=1 Tax=Streptomyces griseus TaxID=1911 RepID=UPI00365724AA
MTPDRLAEYRALIARTTDAGALVASPGVLRELLAEVDRLRKALSDAAVCRCFDPSHHNPDCERAVVVWNCVKYNAASWYRDAEGVWWMACDTDGQGQPLMRVWNDPSNEPVPVSEVESDYGPLYRSDGGPDELNQKAPW